MTFRTLRILGWIALFLLVVEVPLEYRAYKRGWDSILFGREAPQRPADADETVTFGPTADFPFRSRVVSKVKPEGVTRIWIASASYALGENLPVDHVFPTLLEKRLAERGLRTEVLNAGEVGTAIPESVEQLRTHAVAWKPDIVVLYQMSTDIDDLTKRVLLGDPKGDAEPPLLNPRMWLEHTTTYPILKSQLSARLTRMRILARTLEPQGSKRFEKRVRDFLAATREIGAVPVLCTFAGSVDRDDEADLPLHVYRFNIRLGRDGWHDCLDRWNDIIRTVAKEEGVAIADVNAVLHGESEKFVDFVHFTKQGHEDVASVLLEAVAPVVEAREAMNFTTPEFFLFLPLVLVGYVFVFHREHARDVFLLVASYLFYMSWNWQYAGLIAFSTLVDYTVGLKLDRTDAPRKRKALLIVSLCVNLGLLAVFKYFNFFMDTLGDTAGLLSWSFDAPTLRVLLPVGISFYTFQTLSYSIDLYRRKIPVERSLLKFALFVSFFPQLVAGPIVRASEFLPQLHRQPSVNERRFHSGLLLVFRGLIKKCLFADLLAVLVVDAVFENPGAFSSWDLLLALYGYTFQIYNDFSGYSDIAIGIGRMLGFDLPKNFNRPYYARNVREFWSRWHISLSTWLRDYLYIPLGGNRGSKARVTRNLMITMLLGGLWHGAALNFVLWGGYHGLLLVWARGQSRTDMPAPLRVRMRQRFVCFHLVVLGWLFFRIQSGGDLVAFFEGLGALDFTSRIHPGYYAVLAAATLAHFTPQVHFANLSRRFVNLPVPVQAAVYAGLILAITGLSVGGPNFIYFQF